MSDAVKRLFSDLPSGFPVSQDALLRFDNIPPSAAFPEELRSTAAARTLAVVGDAPDLAHIVRKSELVDGAFELAPQLVFDRGLPGKEGVVGESGTRGRTQRHGQGAASRRTIREERLPSHIPDWLTVGFHPVPVFARTARTMVDREGRRTQLMDDIVQIYGSDDRINIRPDTFPECCVCKLTVETQDVRGGPWNFKHGATGFMVGRSVVMTAGHARPPRPYAGWRIKVVPGYFDGVSVFGANVFTFAHSYQAYGSDSGNDLMALGLYDPLGDTTGYFGAISYDDDWEDMAVWAATGYPFDRGSNRPTFQGGISVDDDDDGDDVTLPDGNDVDSTQIETYAETASGASGSPLYSWFDDGHLYAIGAMHGREVVDYGPFGKDSNTFHSGGDMLPAFVRWARAAWP
jgi:hypothetical protein